MSDNRITHIVLNVVRSIIAFGFAFYIVYLVKNGQMNLFIAPRMVILVKLSALALYVIGAYQLLAAYRHMRSDPSHACDHCAHEGNGPGPVWKVTVIYGLFLFPLLLGFFLPNTTMGTALAAQKGMKLSASDSGRVAAVEPAADPVVDEVLPAAPTSEELDRMFEPQPYAEDFARLAKELYQQDVIAVQEELYMEILTAIDLYKEHFVGKTIELSGFIYRDETLRPQQFVVGRFAMECCSADAMPYGLLAEDQQAVQYGIDEWVSMRGVIGLTEYMGNEIMLINPTEIERIAEPDSPYVYPNYSF